MGTRIRARLAVTVSLARVETGGGPAGGSRRCSESSLDDGWGEASLASRGSRRMTKRRESTQRAEAPPDNPGPRRGADLMSLATLIGVVAVLMISFSNWREIDDFRAAWTTGSTTSRRRLPTCRLGRRRRRRPAGARPEPGLHHQDRRGAVQGAVRRPGDDRRVLRLPVTVLREGRSDPQEDRGGLRRQRALRLEAPAARHAQGRPGRAHGLDGRVTSRGSSGSTGRSSSPTRRA